jgi:hypothetical protein
MISYSIELPSFGMFPSGTRNILKVTRLSPKPIATVSPSFTSFEGLASLPFTVTLLREHASFATVRRFIMRDTLRNLSNLILIFLFGFIGGDFGRGV